MLFKILNQLVCEITKTCMQYIWFTLKLVISYIPVTHTVNVLNCTDSIHYIVIYSPT